MRPPRPRSGSSRIAAPPRRRRRAAVTKKGSLAHHNYLHGHGHPVGPVLPRAGTFSWTIKFERGPSKTVFDWNPGGCSDRRRPLDDHRRRRLRGLGAPPARRPRLRCPPRDRLRRKARVGRLAHAAPRRRILGVARRRRRARRLHGRVGGLVPPEPGPGRPLGVKPRGGQFASTPRPRRGLSTGGTTATGSYATVRGPESRRRRTTPPSNKRPSTAASSTRCSSACRPASR